MKHNKSISQINHVRTALVFMALFMSAPLITAGLRPAMADTQTTVGVNSGSLYYSKELYGYYITLSQNGQTINTGFTPTSFPVTIGQTYRIQAANYGNCIFYHWIMYIDSSATSSKDNPVTFTAGANNDISAKYVCGYTIAVLSADANGHTINGYYTTLSQNGAVVGTGYTPTTFASTPGQSYTIEVQDYGQYHFDHWRDTGSTSRDRTVTAVAGELDPLWAVYSNSQSAGSAISVKTVDSSGNAITGYFTTLWQSGNQQNSGYSPTSFAVKSGQTYQVAVSDYGSYTFDHWSDGTTNRFHTVKAGSGTTDITAVYKTS